MYRWETPAMITLILWLTALLWSEEGGEKKDDKHNKSAQIPNFNLTMQSEENQLQTQSSRLQDTANIANPWNNFQLNKKQTPRLRKYYRKWCILAKRQIIVRNQETRNLTVVPTAMIDWFGIRRCGKLTISCMIIFSLQ